MDFCHLLKTQGKISNKYSQKPLDSVKKSTKDALKTVSKRAIQKTRVPKKSSQDDENNNERYISLEKRQQIIDELRLM